MLFVLFLSMCMVSANEIEDNITSISEESLIEIEEDISNVTVESSIVSVDNIDCVDDINLNASNVLQVSSQELIQSDDDVIVVNDWNELQYYCAQTDKDYTLKLKKTLTFIHLIPLILINRLKLRIM